MVSRIDWHRLALLAATAALALGLQGASQEQAAAGPAAGPTADPVRLKLLPNSKVGRVAGTRAYIALSFDGRRLRAYVCDGTRGRPGTISQWLDARWDGHSPITLRRNGIEVRIDAVHADGRVTGRLTAFSGPHAFTVEPASGPAGLYDGTDSARPHHRLRATWIVLADRSIRGAFACPRPPKKRCRVVTVTLADGTSQEQVRCFDVSGC
jgi:hypothetical protein